jgi:RND family efflux transporter MFP subunit
MRAVCLLLSAVLLTAGCRTSHEEDEHAPPPSRLDGSGHIVLTRAERAAIGLQTAVARKGVLTRSSLRFGKVVGRPQENALVVAPVTGRLALPKVALGAHVSAADELVALEPLVSAASQASLQAQRRELQGQVEAAHAEVKARQSELDRASALIASGLGTQAAKAQAEAGLTAEQAREKSLRRAVSDLGRLTGGRIELRAPASGVVASLATDTGALVGQGTVIARIVQPGPRWIDLAVPPGDPVGAAYRVEGVTGSVSARLLSRGVVVQSDGTRRDRLEAPPEAAADLPPGAIVAVEVRYPTHGVVVPARAVVRRGSGSVVFVQLRDGRYRARSVKVGARDATRSAITSGLAAGDRVVSRGAWALLGVLARAPPGAGDAR